MIQYVFSPDMNHFTTSLYIFELHHLDGFVSCDSFQFQGICHLELELQLCGMLRPVDVHTVCTKRDERQRWPLTTLAWSRCISALNICSSLCCRHPHLSAHAPYTESCQPSYAFRLSTCAVCLRFHHWMALLQKLPTIAYAAGRFCHLCQSIAAGYAAQVPFMTSDRILMLLAYPWWYF